MKKLVVANWKMNPQTREEASRIFSGIKLAAKIARRTEVVVCPPFLFINELAKKSNGEKKLFVGGQDVFYKTKGPFTGEISPSMLKNIGANWVIIGHSERRALGESNEEITQKINSSIIEGLNVILCVGEKERDTDGTYLEKLKNQILKSISSVRKKEIANLVIAYEPIWLIGKRSETAMDPHSIHEMVIFIRKVLNEKYGKEIAWSIPILYGGSVNEANDQSLILDSEISGFLVGGASLDPKKFAEIIKEVDSKYHALY